MNERDERNVFEQIDPKKQDTKAVVQTKQGEKTRVLTLPQRGVKRTKGS